MTGIILIIDHDMELAQALAVYLERQKFEVHLADSAKIALTMIENINPAIILADPCSPGCLDPNSMDFDILKQVKSIKPQSQLIIYSMADGIEKTMEFFQSDALDYIKKTGQQH